MVGKNIPLCRRGAESLMRLVFIAVIHIDRLEESSALQIRVNYFEIWSFLMAQITISESNKA